MRPEIQQAVELARQGRPESLDAALALLQNTVYSFSMRVCGHREDAEDTMQETLLRTAPALRNFESPQALAVWLYKVARSRCLMSRRHRKHAPRETISLDDVMPDRTELESLLADHDDGPEKRLLEGENRARLQQAVLEIPPDYRLILVLHDMEELSTAEIAGITGLRPGTIRVRLHRARAYLRDLLSRGGRRHARRRRLHPPQRRCKRIFAQLSAYLDKEIDPATWAQLEAHLAGCKPCEAYLASLEETIRRCRRHCPEAVRAEVARKVRQLVLQLLESKSLT